MDIANLGYCDASRVTGVRALREDGLRILLVMLLRRHVDWAPSMMTFRWSRGEYSALRVAAWRRRSCAAA